MRKFIRALSITIAVLLAIFWTIGFFSVDESEILTLLCVAVATEIVPILIAGLMKRSLRKSALRDREAKERASIPIWIREDERNEEKSPETSGRTEKPVVMPIPPVPPEETEEEPAEKAAEQKEPKDVAEETASTTEDVDDANDDAEKTEMDRLQRTMTRAVNEVVELHGLSYAVYHSSVPEDMAKSILTVFATGCQRYETSHPMYKVLSPLLHDTSSVTNIAATVWSLTGDYMFACGVEDPYLELRGILRGFASTGCKGKVFRPVLYKWIEDNGKDRKRSPFKEVEKLLKNKEGAEGLYKAIRSVADYKIPI